jgi:hypothetical protein
MESMELPRIGNRTDALELLDRLIKLVHTGKKNKELVPGLQALKDVLEREAL